MDYAFWWDDRDVAAHDGAETLRGEDVRLEGERGVHDDAVEVEEPEYRCVWEGGHCMAEGWDARPAGGDGAKGVGACVFDEEAVACGG